MNADLQNKIDRAIEVLRENGPNGANVHGCGRGGGLE